MPLDRLCVFCGSSRGHSPAYVTAAAEVGKLLAERRIGVVYGGASIGLMGALADAAQAAGGEVIGVIPRALVEWELAHTGLADLRVVASMHERKALMAELSDGFIALPGGIGTLEAFEVWTWAAQRPMTLRAAGLGYAGRLNYRTCGGRGFRGRCRNYCSWFEPIEKMGYRAPPRRWLPARR
jgi:uncharacterized protein (TIGR00730 family)